MHDFEPLQGWRHRGVAARLSNDGWNVCGVGDWATVWRSPDGLQAARLSPFEPAYEVFVRLCRALPGHPMLPRIDFDAPLPGGARLTVMEFLRPAAAEDADALKQRWSAAAPGDPVTAVRREAERLDAEASEAIPFWGGLDDNPHNIMVAESGEPKFIDLFYVAGLELYAALLENPSAVARAFAPEQRQHLADIGAVTRLSTAAEIVEIRRAAADLD
ncbi:hypothetical protein [Glycomyces tarimensis]